MTGGGTIDIECPWCERRDSLLITGPPITHACPCGHAQYTSGSHDEYMNLPTSGVMRMPGHWSMWGDAVKIITDEEPRP